MCDNSRSIGLFCSKNNDMIDIDDINSSKETNDIYDETLSKFNSFYNKAKNLKSSIEDYICEINKSAKRAFREMNKAFRKEHYLISRTRYKLKDELNGKIDNIKEELNNFLKRTENIISSFADISKAIESFGKLKESHIIRTWCYISEINKYNEKANNLFKEPKKHYFFPLMKIKILLIIEIIILMVYLFLKIYSLKKMTKMKLRLPGKVMNP